jgi:uncharacterized protein involved in exopolysaccharide biosynthesis
MLVVAFAVGLLSVTADRTYTSATTFMPQSEGSRTNIGGLAAQFGVMLPGEEGSWSPAFYAELIKSRRILERIVDTRFPTASDSIRLLTIALQSEGKTPALKREAAIKQLAGFTTTTVFRATSTIRLAVTTHDPVLAQRIAARYLELLSDFNMMTRQSQGAAQRKFTGQRVEEVKVDLKRAEDSLQVFLQQNRDYGNSPQLTFQADRLRRDVAMQQQVYTTLVQAHEQAKIEEVRDTPVLTIIELPQSPILPDSRRVVLKTFLGLVLGGMFGVGLALWREYLKTRSGTKDPDLEEFVRLRGSLLGDLRHPLQALKRGLAHATASSPSPDGKPRES